MIRAEAFPIGTVNRNIPSHSDTGFFKWTTHGLVYFVLAFFLANCTPSKYAIDQVDGSGGRSGERASFRGIALGTDLKKVRGIEIIGGNNICKLCVIPNEPLRIGDIPLSSIKYTFIHDKLAYITIEFPPMKMSAIVDMVIEKYGPHSHYSWKVGNDLVGVHIDMDTMESYLMYVDLDIQDMKATCGLGDL